MDYRREIDGLRALAVIPVILFHAGFKTFSGGFVGVDVFFVISGYLITTIIISELKQGKFSIINFYERRARRILPALFLVMFVCIPFAWFWLLPNDMKDFSQSLVAVSVFGSNILFWRESGYFDTAAELKPLLHTWSLAVEEQYYVLFPLFLMLFWKLGKRWTVISLASLFTASLAVSQMTAYSEPSTAFYLLPGRGWELLMGAFAALYLSQANRKDLSKSLSEMAGWVGLVLILFAIFTYSKATLFPGPYALVPTLGAVLIILFATQQTTVGRFVGNKVFVGIGLLSYSAYLWHQPLFAFARHKSPTEPTHLVFLLLSLIAIVLAYFSWRFVEAPFRNKVKFTKKFIFSSAFIFSFFFISTGYLGHLRNGNFWKYSDDVARYFEFKNESDANVWELKNKLRGVGFDDHKVKILVVGDSNSADFLNVFHGLDKERRFSFSTLRIDVGCGNLYFPRNRLFRYLDTDRAKTCTHVDDLTYQSSTKLMSQADWVIFASSWRNWELDLFEESYQKLRSDFGDKFLIFGTKELDFSPKEFIRANNNASFPIMAHRESDKAEINLKLKKIVRDRFIDPYDYLCEGVNCKMATEKGDLLLYDGMHLSKRGIDFFALKLGALASQLAEKP